LGAIGNFAVFDIFAQLLVHFHLKQCSQRKFEHVAFEIRDQTDRHEDTHADRNTLHPTTGEVTTAITCCLFYRFI